MQEENILDQDNAQEQLSADMELLANKLYLLIQNLNADEETKNAIIDMLAAFSLEQLQKFADVLEASYLNEQNGQYDEQLKQDLQKVVEEYQQQDQKDNDVFFEQINLLSQNI